MTNMKNDNKIFDLVFFSILAALEVVLTITGLGFIQLGGFASITILHVPVLIGAIVLGKKYGAGLGLVFGLSSCILAFVRLGTDAPFTNPLLSVLPRVIFGFLVCPIYSLLNNLIKNKTISSGLTFAICTFIHTILVVFILYFVGKYNFYFFASENPYSMNSNLFSFMLLCFTINSLIEVLLAVIIGLAISVPLDVLRNKSSNYEN